MSGQRSSEVTARSGSSPILGILWAGGVVVPLDARATPTEWTHLMNHSECRFLFAASEHCSDIAKQKEMIPSLQEIIAFSGEKGDSNLPSIFQGCEGIDGTPRARKRESCGHPLYLRNNGNLERGHAHSREPSRQCRTVCQGV